MAGMDFMLSNMLSNMIGMKPDELQTAVKKTIATIEAFAETMSKIENRLTAIEEHLGVTNNGNCTNGSGKLTISDNRDIQL